MSLIDIEELRATRNLIDGTIDKLEQEEMKEKGYIELAPPPTREQLQLLTINEVAKEYGIGSNRIRRLTKASKENSLDFPCIKMGNKTLIPRGLFEEWLYKACKEGLKID